MPHDGFVANLKEKVKAETEHQLAHIAPNELVVWKCPGLNDIEEDEVLVAHIYGLDFAKTEEVQRLRETEGYRASTCSRVTCCWCRCLVRIPT